MISKTLFKYFPFIIIYILSPLSLSSQQKINWSEFKEPDGKITFITISPSAEIWDSRRFRINTQINSRDLKNLSILNYNLGLSYNNFKSENTMLSNTITFRPNLEWKKRSGTAPY